MDPGFRERLTEGYASEDDEELKSMMETVDAGLTEYRAGDRILTDDRAPVELLGMKAIDRIIRDEVSYYKEIYRTYGIKGLMEQL